MSSTFYEPDIKGQIGRMYERLESLARHPRNPLSDEQLERERIQYEHNAFAERCPLFNSARSAAMQRLVLPLEPNGLKPLAKDASSDPARLFEWWTQEPSANVGVVVGRVGNLIALEVADDEAMAHLRAMAKVVHPATGEDEGQDYSPSYTEYQALDAAWVRFRREGQPIRVTEFQGWGKEPVRRKQAWYDSLKNPERCWLVWSYPRDIAVDAWDYRNRRLGSGLRVLGEGEVIPWSGSIIDNAAVVAPDGALPNMPPWLSKKIGQPRSRKVMAAVQAQAEAQLRQENAKFHAREALLRKLEEEERGKAIADRARAEKALTAAMSEGGDDG